MTPICICNGVMRSGSTWSFNVCRELMREEAGRRNEKFNSEYLDSQPLEQFIARRWPMNQSPTVIKAHNLGMNALAMVRKGQAKAVCTYRDPRDCIASDLAFTGYPLEVCLARVGMTITPIRVYLSARHFLLVRYEQMMIDRAGEIRRIAAHLGIAVDDAFVRRVDERTNMQSSERICRALRNQPADDVIEIADHRVDPVTHLHENHINGGTVGRWKTELTAEQAAIVTEHFAPWLLQMRYETSESLQKLMSELTSPGRESSGSLRSGIRAASDAKFAPASSMSV